MFTLKISRGTSGFEGTYETMAAAISRLTEYCESFPNDVIRITITKK